MAGNRPQGPTTKRGLSYVSRNSTPESGAVMLNHDYLQGIDPLASSHDCIDAIGWEVQIGKRKKRAPKERQKRLEGEMKKHEVRVRKAKNTIAAIQNNPATHLAIAAVATLVPYGT